MNKKDFLEAFRTIYDLFPGSFTERRHELYFEQFKSISAENWEKTVEFLVQNASKFPNIPEIRKIISENRLWPLNTDKNGLVVSNCPTTNCTGVFCYRRTDLINAVKMNGYYRCLCCGEKYSAQMLLDYIICRESTDVVNKSE